MFILSITPGQIAGAVWVNATRVLTADPFTDAGGATLVWTHATRQLSSLAANLTGIQSINTSVGAGAVLDLRPAAGKFRHVSISQESGTGCVAALYDGATAILDVSAVKMVTLVGNNTVGPAAKNASGGALPVAYSGYDIS